MNETELLFTEILNCDRISLYQNRNLSIDRNKLSSAADALKRRILGEPIQYILRRTEFMGLEFRVDKKVFIPRPETEILVETAIDCIKVSKCQSLKVLDMCTGCGNIAISLAKLLPHIDVYATDISQDALDVAVSNARFNRVDNRIKFLLADLYIRGQNPSQASFAYARDSLWSQDTSPKDTKARRSEPLPSRVRMNNRAASVFRFGKPRAEARPASFNTYSLLPIDFDLIVSNPPYIKSGEIDNLQPEIKFEPRIALDGGKDGLDFYRRIIQQVPVYLKKGGLLIMEMGFKQNYGIKNIFLESGNFKLINVVKDYNNINRVVVARLLDTDSIQYG